jgi:exonuclease VII small subunit
MSERYEQIAERLETLVADLDEIAFDELRAAAADGATRRPDSDKRLTAARRSLEKAIHLLRQ